jgi:hypothetical protein
MSKSPVAVRGHHERRTGRRGLDKEPVMFTVTSSPATTSATVTGRSRSPLTRTLPRATASAAVLGAAATTAGAAVLSAAGVPLAAHGAIPLAGFAQVTFVAAVTGGLVLAVLNRYGSAPRRRFLQVTVGLTTLSIAAPATLADTTASSIALAGLHVLAAAVIIPVLARRAR